MINRYKNLNGRFISEEIDEEGEEDCRHE